MLSATIDKTVDVLSGLTQKIINIKSKTDQCLTNENYIELNNKIDILSAMFSSNESDIVSLLNLPRPISDYKNEHIGETISIPYTDDSGNITGPIVFEVVGVNNHKYINNPNKPTITLMTKNIIRYAVFDVMEPNNPLYDEGWGETQRAKVGNNRWSVSNIRQWLNSEGAANKWFTPQHEYDEAPGGDKITFMPEYEDGVAGYADDPGFLAGFSSEIKQHFATVRNKTILCNTDRSVLSKDFEESEDKVFLPSYTEMGFGNLDSNNSEGVHLAQKFTDDESRIKSGVNNEYWLRSQSWSAFDVYYVSNDGSVTQLPAASGDKGIAPLIVLC